MLPQSNRVSRTGSASSISSDDSIVSTESNNSTDIASTGDSNARRTRKRFSSVQLMMLEHLYHQTSHPTREQREALAREADITEMRSVTVWFQNKRQTERRVALNSATDAALSSPFSAAVSGQTIHTHRRTPSIASTTASPGRASIERERPRLHGSALTGARRPSLDHIAARIERPNPLTRSHTAPELSPPRPRTPDRPLWENMPSSPHDPEPGPQVDRVLVDFEHARRRRTLEWACAAARVGGAVKEAEADAPELVLDLEDFGDTEDEAMNEVVTPSSSIGRGRRWSMKQVDEVGENMMEIDEGGMKANEDKMVCDDDVMDAALALCGLGQKR